MNMASAIPTQSELNLALRMAQAEKLDYAAWPEVLRQAYARDRRKATISELKFHQIVGLVVAMASVLLDLVAVPDQVMHGLVLRLTLIMPPALMVILFARRMELWQVKFLTGFTLTAFGCVVMHLAAHADADSAMRYTMAISLLLGGAMLIQPYSPRELALFGTAFVCCTTLAGQFPTALPPAMLIEHAVLVALVGGAGYALAQRFFRLKAREYLAELSLRVAHAELEQSNLVLRELSESDALTGLANRRSFRSAFQEMFTGSQDGDQSQVTLMMIDLDRFKRFNDHHGHQAGDRALRMVARCLEECFEREDGIIARFGGEEFIGAVRSKTIADAEKLAERIRTRVRGVAIPVRDLDERRVTCSIGLASTTSGAKVDMSQLIARADRALYRAKQTGRDKVVVSERIELRVDRLVG
jgi:diguanylate cyclase (GGDEF)-like protein